MTRYIDADLLEEQFVNNCKKVGDSVEDWGMFDDDFYMMLKEVPTADVQPVVHGYWKYDKSTRYKECSICGKKPKIIGTIQYKEFKFCPSCGAIMDEGDEHD